MKPAFQKIRGLLIDIDDTVVRVKREADGELSAKSGHWSASLLHVLQAAGVELGGWTAEETARRIAKIKTEMRWWHWSDFIVALELKPKAFWRYALEMEQRYLEPTGSEMHGAMQRLHGAGILLYVTSNNPSSGILHKLHVAGLATVNGSTMFSQLLGACELQAMKWEPIYWKKALAHTGMDADEVAVVGDSYRDDFEVPQSVGIKHTFLIDRSGDRSSETTDEISYVTDFSQIADCLLGALPVPGIGADAAHQVLRQPEAAVN